MKIGEAGQVLNDFENFSDIVRIIWQGLCDILALWVEDVFTYILQVFELVVDTILNVLDFFIGFKHLEQRKIGSFQYNNRH